MAKRSPQQNRRIYEARKQRAIEAGYTGYAERRKIHHQLLEAGAMLIPPSRTEALTALANRQLTTEFDELAESLGSVDLGTLENDTTLLSPAQERALGKLLGARLITFDQYMTLAGSDTFWQDVRPFLEKLSP